MSLQTNRYNSRSDEVRAEISKDEVIRLIEQVYHSQYVPNHGLDGCFDVWDQLLACESIGEATSVRESTNTEEKIGIDENRNDYKDCIGSCKHTTTTNWVQCKNDAISKLCKCRCRTNPALVSELLEDIFSDYSSYSGYWFYVAQKWPPKRIIEVINKLVKLENPGHVTTRNHAKYFNFLIQRKTPRKQYIRDHSKKKDILQSNI